MDVFLRQTEAVQRTVQIRGKGRRHMQWPATRGPGIASCQPSLYAVFPTNGRVMWQTGSSTSSPALLCLLLNGLRVALALLVQLVALDPQELEDTDLPRLSELTFLVLLVAVLLQSATQQQPVSRLISQQRLRSGARADSKVPKRNYFIQYSQLKRWEFLVELFKAKWLDQ